MKYRDIRDLRVGDVYIYRYNCAGNRWGTPIEHHNEKAIIKKIVPRYGPTVGPVNVLVTWGDGTEEYVRPEDLHET
jgi:hypothetical protein